MFSDFDKISFPNMSNSEFFGVQDNQEDMEFNLLKMPVLEFQEECSIAVSRDPACPHPQQHQEQEAQDENNEQEAECKVKDCLRPSLGELKATVDDDGFKTPTSLDHKIPVTKQCPPAPRKPKPLLSTKRKASPSNVRRSLQLDLSQDVESLFPRPSLSGLYQKMKKARRDNDT